MALKIFFFLDLLEEHQGLEMRALTGRHGRDAVLLETILFCVVQNIL